MNLISLFVTAFLAENIVLTKFLGLCPIMGNSKNVKTATKMGFLVVLTTLLSSLISYFFYYKILVPTSTEYLETLIFVFTIASIVGVIEILVKYLSPKLYQSLGIYLPLITTNCSVLGVSLLVISNQFTLLETIVYAFGSSLGFLVVMYIFSNIRTRIDASPVPKGFKDAPIAFITLGIIALLFTRYGL